MPRITRNHFSELLRCAHVVVVIVDAASSNDADLRDAHRLLQRLVRSQEPARRYGTSIVRETGTPELQVAFEGADDAAALATVLKAHPAPAKRGRARWESDLDAGLRGRWKAAFPPGAVLALQSAIQGPSRCASASPAGHIGGPAPATTSNGKFDRRAIFWRERGRRDGTL
jgi:hypothetical protein